MSDTTDPLRWLSALCRVQQEAMEAGRAAPPIDRYECEEAFVASYRAHPHSAAELLSDLTRLLPFEVARDLVMDIWNCWKGEIDGFDWRHAGTATGCLMDALAISDNIDDAPKEMLAAHAVHLFHTAMRMVKDGPARCRDLQLKVGCIHYFLSSSKVKMTVEIAY